MRTFVRVCMCVWVGVGMCSHNFVVGLVYCNKLQALDFFCVASGDSEDQGRLLVATLMSKQQFTLKYLVILLCMVTCYCVC